MSDSVHAEEGYVNTPQERRELQDLIRLGVDITRPLEEQSPEAQAAYRGYEAGRNRQDRKKRNR